MIRSACSLVSMRERMLQKGVFESSSKPPPCSVRVTPLLLQSLRSRTKIKYLYLAPRKRLLRLSIACSAKAEQNLADQLFTTSMRMPRLSGQGQDDFIDEQVVSTARVMLFPVAMMPRSDNQVTRLATAMAVLFLGIVVPLTSPSLQRMNIGEYIDRAT